MFRIIDFRCIPEAMGLFFIGWQFIYFFPKSVLWVKKGIKLLKPRVPETKKEHH